MKEKELSRRVFLGKIAEVGFLAVTGLMLIVSNSCSDITSDFGVFSVDAGLCTGCKDCLKGCSHNAISIQGGVAVISVSRCSSCGKCVSYCKNKAISQS